MLGLQLIGDPVQALVVVLAALSTAVGLLIGYQAYRGFRRHDSRPMQLLSVGLVLITAVTYSISFGGTILFREGILPLAYQQAHTVVVRVTQLAGLSCILYSLYSR
ncbi:DUF7521 family protein [Haloarchaeobius salinus]|uniref:DUF7521 family protein n=1 Tax=Haloarchaeobius salinus TaxID=1198298 RepID=UPI00210D536D|nr:hypothetical protein [Haloarchaeobius salinus]